jgi:methionyl-tRNA synthetase
MTKDTYFLTTPIYYVNDKPHLGHAYTSVACDAIARYMRLDGMQVKFLTGTDEHGQKVEKSAAAAGVPPQAFVDEVSEHFRDMAKILNLTNDDFIRTTEPRHIAAAQEMWKRLEASGDIYLANYGGWYATRDEAFYAESELVDGKAPTGAEVEWVEEPSYFFKLSKYQQPLLDFYEKNPDFILPTSRRNEVISFVKGGLNDLSISRTTFKWGIPVPGDEAHIMYVWLDALTNYWTASKDNGFWPADLHMVGKDILRFHTVYWPAFLMSAKLELPKRVFAHGWWTIEGEKMSKSLGNVVAPAHLVEKYGLDQTRYFLLREVPFGSDGNFSRQSMFERINADLANNIGNLAQRTLSMIAKNCDGKVPALDAANIQPQDAALMEQVRVTSDATHNSAREQMQRCKFGEVIGAILAMSSAANEYIDKEAPWTLKKTDLSRMNSVLYYLAESIRCIAIMLQPFTPDAAAKLLDQLAVSADERLFKHLTPEFALKSGTQLPKPEGVFPRLMAEVA